MHFFRYAQDYYGDWLAVQLLPEAAAILAWLVALFVGSTCCVDPLEFPFLRVKRICLPSSVKVESKSTSWVNGCTTGATLSF